MSLEHKLERSAESWLGEEELSPAQEALLAGVVRQRAASRSRRSWFRMGGAAAAAAAVVAATVFAPVVVSVATDAPLVGPFIARWAKYDQGAHWAVEKGYVVPVDKSVTDKGYTFRVESVVADAARTDIYWVIEGPDLTAPVLFPNLRGAFNMADAGHSGGRHELVDGRLVGRLTLPPLPHPTALVEVRMTEVAGVAGDWQVSFMASRAELDKQTRRITVEQQLQGDGYDLTVTELILAPTETVVTLTGKGGEGLDLREVQLLADGKPVGIHGGTANGNSDGQVSWQFAFDRVEGEPADLTLRLGSVIAWTPGGPAIDLTQSGARTEHNRTAFVLESVGTVEGNTTVVLQIEQPGQNDAPGYHDFRGWVLIDADGKEHRWLSLSVPAGAGLGSMSLTFEGEIPNPIRVEAREHAVPAARDLMVPIPLN